MVLAVFDLPFGDECDAAYNGAMVKPDLWVAGVDGCRAGWFVVLRKGEELKHRLVGRFSEVHELEERPAIVAADMPIGLLDCAVEGGRECDRLARELLGERGCCVFSPPVRGALRCSSHPVASGVNKRSSDAGIGITTQAFGLFPKLCEVDAAMRPALQNRVFEVHPEVSFYELNRGSAMADRKKSPAGFAARQELLEGAGFGALILDALASWRRKDVGRDDVLDACIACWSAGRVLHGSAMRIPEIPPLDGRGLRMEIWR